MTILRKPHAGLLVVALVACGLVVAADARAADAWEYIAGIGVARASAAVAAVDGKVYVIGGRANGVLKTTAVENSVEVYDPAANTWTALAPKPTGVVNDEAGVIGGIIYVPGGGVLEAYNPATNTWATRAPMPAVVSSGTVAVVGSKLYVLGGKVEGVVVGTCYVYDQPGNTWSTCAAMTFARQSAGAGVIDGKIYVYGGDEGASLAQAATWSGTTRPTTPGPRWPTPGGTAGLGWASSGTRGSCTPAAGPTASGTRPIPTFRTRMSNACNTYDPGTNTWAAVRERCSGRGQTMGWWRPAAASTPIGGDSSHVRRSTPPAREARSCRGARCCRR